MNYCLKYPSGHPFSCEGKICIASLEEALAYAWKATARIEELEVKLLKLELAHQKQVTHLLKDITPEDLIQREEEAASIRMDQRQILA